eukprot:6191048-Pleurochrysis_carterae.AAC.1
MRRCGAQGASRPAASRRRSLRLVRRDLRRDSTDSTSLRKAVERRKSLLPPLHLARNAACRAAQVKPAVRALFRIPTAPAPRLSQPHKWSAFSPRIRTHAHTHAHTLAYTHAHAHAHTHAHAHAHTHAHAHAHSRTCTATRALPHARCDRRTAAHVCSLRALSYAHTHALSLAVSPSAARRSEWLSSMRSILT